ncbi:MAG: alpha/beta hydrolase, partial [Desulfobacteraceae bacterium]|nr:alpha/beta hydrolase [Desulfobacteraceae bacterium]
MKMLEISKALTIAYQEIQGDDRKPTILFLHEGLGCIKMWKQFPEQLCRQLGCPGLVYDRQGYGNSSPLSKMLTVHFMHDYA